MILYLLFFCLLSKSMVLNASSDSTGTYISFDTRVIILLTCSKSTNNVCIYFRSKLGKKASGNVYND